MRVSSLYNYFTGIFANLVDLLEPNDVELPSELLQSQHLHFQRKRKCFQGDDTNEKKEKQQKIDYRNKSVWYIFSIVITMFSFAEIPCLIFFRTPVGHGKENINN